MSQEIPKNVQGPFAVTEGGETPEQAAARYIKQVAGASAVVQMKRRNGWSECATNGGDSDGDRDKAVSCVSEAEPSSPAPRGSPEILAEASPTWGTNALVPTASVAASRAASAAAAKGDQENRAKETPIVNLATMVASRFQLLAYDLLVIAGKMRMPVFGSAADGAVADAEEGVRFTAKLIELRKTLEATLKQVGTNDSVLMSNIKALAPVATKVPYEHENGEVHEVFSTTNLLIQLMCVRKLPDDEAADFKRRKEEAAAIVLKHKAQHASGQWGSETASAVAVAE